MGKLEGDTPGISGGFAARPRFDVSVGACVRARVRIYNEAELTGKIDLNL